VQADGPRPALHVKRGEQFEAITWNELSADVLRAAAMFKRLGVAPGDRVVQVSENRYEWIVCDMAIQMARAIHVPIHSTLAGGQIAYQITDSGAQVVVFSTAEQAAKLASVDDSLPQLSAVLSYEPCHDTIARLRVSRFVDHLNDISNEEASAVERDALDHLTADELVTILYTSGTTGEPKGVMLSQRNLTSNVWATIEAHGFEDDDVRLNFLPLSHVFARTCDLYIWMAIGCQLALCESREKVLENCAEIKPTAMNGVPYFFDKVARYLIQNDLADTPGALRSVLGGNMRNCCAGGAALPDHVAELFERQGIPLLQGYGLTETSPVIAISAPHAYKIGAIGRAIPGVEVRFTDEGELLTRGPHVMMGYWNRPEETAETIRGGWLYTGDLGEQDADGYLRITGRKKEIIVTAAGKNIAPTFLEALLCEDPLIAQAIVLGDGRKFLSALVVPEWEPLLAACGAAGQSAEQAACNVEIVAYLQAHVDERLTAVSREEQIRKIAIVPEPFTIERGELTPTLKVRRKVIEEHYGDRIAEMYSVESIE
jgi:long-chain acyl-CoA synthetase